MATVKIPSKPTPLEAALLLLRLAEAKEEERRTTDRKKEKEEQRGKLTRFRISETTLKRLCRRRRIPLDYLLEVQEWLHDAGWALFFTGSNYAMIKSSSVEGWVRLSSKRIASELSNPEFKFEKLYHLLDQEPESEED
jgi:hypothetical protein